MIKCSKTIYIFMLLTIISCSTNIQKVTSNVIISETNLNKIEKKDDKIFISGYISNEVPYYYDGKTVAIGLNDSIFYYKYNNKSTYEYMPVKPLFMDLSKENVFSIIPKITNLQNNDYQIDDWLQKKLYDHDKNYYTFMNQSPLYITKQFFKYNSKSFRSKGYSDISFDILLQPKYDPDPIVFKVAKFIILERKIVSDFFYIESYPKQFKINRVEYNNGLFYAKRPNNAKFIKWDFIEAQDCNYFIIFYDNPAKIPLNIKFFDVSVFGQYKK